MSSRLHPASTCHFVPSLHPCPSQEASFENVAKWLAELQDNATTDITVALVGNKTDLQSYRAVTTERGKTYADEQARHTAPPCLCTLLTACPALPVHPASFLPIAPYTPPRSVHPRTPRTPRSPAVPQSHSHTRAPLAPPHAPAALCYTV